MIPEVSREDIPTQDRDDQVVAGPPLADITNAIVQLYKECYGKGPTKARTTFEDDLVVCVLEGGFQQAERTLRDAGQGEVVEDQREAFQEVLRERFIQTVEDLTGRTVRAFVSGVDLETEVSAEVFVLEPELEMGDEREAVRAWAEQTRRSARTLREEQVGLREQARREQERLARQSPKRSD